ncbi:multidrug resistance-associated ABC transporter [Mycena albidolilacea]|uniref:Multidrug resistance-associated ABC transporter n=1 Tax=Mycena albidolilacea TaxID=1033008 RepID=A0AAD7A9N9_9AGAR|nr:multidrug resistance-associated ABC transporter [Mycena albidolilacea]
MQPFDLNWPVVHLEPLDIPAASSTLSVVILALYLAFKPAKGPKGPTGDHSALNISRLSGCLALLAISIRNKTASLPSFWSLSLTYVYVSLLTLLSICARRPICDHAARHSTFVLLSTLGVYLYRNVLPLGFPSGAPQDSEEGRIMWIVIALLVFIGLLVPLLSPREYTPVDPLNPMEVPNPEQTASILSLVFYAFLDPTIVLAHRLGRLPYDLLPPLADYDCAQYLRSRNFKYIERRRHLFFGLVRVFHVEILILAATSAIIVLGKFVVPIGLNNLLHYIENKGADVSVRPWVWIVWLFAGPTVQDLGDQWYMFIVSRATVRAEAILTELLFEHALRIRIKSEPAAKGSAQDRNLLGRLNNMITTDIRLVIASKRLLLSLVYMPLMLVLCVWFLYAVLGWSAFVGMAITFAMLPVPGYVGKWVQTAQRNLAKKRDARVQTVTETINLLRMVKLFGWESNMSAEVDGKRQVELVYLWKRKVLDLVNGCIDILLPIITMLATYSTYVSAIIMKQELTASKVFSSMTVFDMFKTSVQGFLSSYTLYITSKVSLDRMDDFLRNTELLDVFSSEDRTVAVPSENQNDIGFHDATFSWSDTPAPGEDSSARRFSLHIDHLVFKQGCINLILGQTGSGKTTLLLSLLGETYFTPVSPQSWYSLPRAGGVAYAAQESWVQSATIKENIVFGGEFNAERYRKVLYQCCLEKDLELFAAGDEQVVGERGLTLSGGQQARVTLARAVYSQASILLLDDVLAALDVHTAKWIVDKCLGGDLIAGRTVLLVTHNIALVHSVSQFAVSLGVDGRIISQGSVHDALAKDVKFSIKASDDQVRPEAADEGVNTSSTEKQAAGGKLIVAEEIMEGAVPWSAVQMYLHALGGKYSTAFWVALLVSSILQNFAGTLQTWYLGYWSSQYDTRPASEVPVLYYLGVYGSVLLLLFFFYACGFLLYTFGILRASKSLHLQLVDSVLGTTLRWLDKTPTSRITARFTQDMGMVDGPIATGLWAVADSTVSLAITFGAIVLFTPVFFAPGITLFALGAFCGRLFMPARISIKREMSVARSPVLGHFAAAVTGLTSIRAYGCQRAFIQESLRRLDAYSRSARLSFDLTRWSAIRTDMLSNLFTASLAVYLVYFKNYSAANTGFSLHAAVKFSSTITSWILRLNDFQLLSNNLERIEAYTRIEQEPKPTKDGVPPTAWPTSGALAVRNLSARYSQDGPNVLHDVSFIAKSGERIGIVGRTGSGKSSLTLALLRAIITEGSVFYDGIASSSINLDALRSKITIIPQMPELLSGTLRRNLDPFEQFEDTELKRALGAAGLYSLQTEGAENNITLDTDISSGGNNLSVGQRQILALARAMIRQNKLVILDEATSAIDYQIDAVIQNSLRTGLGSDVTTLIVAHRLQSVMDADRIMVLDSGRIVEFDTPQNLLEIEDGRFRALLDGSEDRDALYEKVQDSKVNQGVE